MNFISTVALIILNIITFILRIFFFLLRVVLFVVLFCITLGHIGSKSMKF